MFYLMKLKYTIFFNIKVTKIERSAFLRTPGIFALLSVYSLIVCISKLMPNSALLT